MIVGFFYQLSVGLTLEYGTIEEILHLSRLGSAVYFSVLLFRDFIL